MTFSISGLLRSLRRTFWSNMLLFFLTYLIIQYLDTQRKQREFDEFFAPRPPPPLGPPLPPRTPIQTDAECRASRFAVKALTETFESFGANWEDDADTFAQYNSVKALLQGPENCAEPGSLNFTSPAQEWRYIFKNLRGMNLIQDLDGKYPKEQRPMPSLMVPRAAPPEVRADLAVAMSLVAQLLMSERNGKTPVAANSFDQFHVRQGHKRWFYGYRKKDLATGIVEDFAFFNNTRNVTLENGSEEIEHFTNAKRFPSWLAVGNTTHHPALARRLTSRTSLHTYCAIKLWRSNQQSYLALAGKVQRNADCGDGIIVRVTADNATVYEKDIPPAKEPVEHLFEARFHVQVGSTVEIQIDPKNDDACDRTLLWTRIFDVDED